MNDLVVVASAVLAISFAWLVVLRCRRASRGAYRFIVSLKPLARLLTDDRTH